MRKVLSTDNSMLNWSTCLPYKNAGPNRAKRVQFNSNLKCNFKTLFVEFYWQLWGFSSSLAEFFIVLHLLVLSPLPLCAGLFCILPFWNEKLDFCPLFVCVLLYECGSLIEIENRMQRIETAENNCNWKKNFIIFTVCENTIAFRAFTLFWRAAGTMVQLINPFSFASATSVLEKSK